MTILSKNMPETVPHEESYTEIAPKYYPRQVALHNDSVQQRPVELVMESRECQFVTRFYLLYVYNAPGILSH